MNLKKVLRPETVHLGLSGTSKDAIIEEMVDIMSDAFPQMDKEAVLSAVLAREAQMSTGMKNGIAIPHGKTDAVKQLYAAIGISREGVDFECLDNKPARIFVMTASPASRTGPHLQFLAEVSRLLSRSELRTRILEAESSRELLNIFLEG
ncbi:MAG: PTS sucrose transporter subunit IIABC [Spirochaetales bacterium]|nr:MAG: PTS sucrose transporter subunit IIABC [Spirochaetales bacterium]